MALLSSQNIWAKSAPMSTTSHHKPQTLTDFDDTCDMAVGVGVQEAVEAGWVSCKEVKQGKG